MHSNPCKRIRLCSMLHTMTTDFSPPPKASQQNCGSSEKVAKCSHLQTMAYFKVGKLYITKSFCHQLSAKGSSSRYIFYNSCSQDNWSRYTRLLSIKDILKTGSSLNVIVTGSNSTGSERHYPNRVQEKSLVLIYMPRFVLKSFYERTVLMTHVRSYLCFEEVYPAHGGFLDCPH